MVASGRLEQDRVRQPERGGEPPKRGVRPAVELIEAWMVKRSEIVNLGGLWVGGHGLPE